MKKSEVRIQCFAWTMVCMLGLGSSATAALLTYDFTVGAAIPDDGTPYVNSQVIQDGTQGNAIPSGSKITKLSVRFQVSGGVNGDLYVYLRHETAGGTGFTVMLNRVGTSMSNPLGYTDPGFGAGFLLTDTGNDVHNYQNFSPTYTGSGQLTGTWQVDQSGGPNSFSSFQGLDPTGTWSIFFADLSGGNVSTVDTWGFDAIVEVPEPVNYALAIFAGLVGITTAVRRYKAKKENQIC